MKKSKENLTEIKLIAEIKVLEQQNDLTKQSPSDMKKPRVGTIEITESERPLY